MVYGIHKRGRVGARILPNSRAMVLRQCGQCRRAGRMKGRLIRAQTTSSKIISWKGQCTAPSLCYFVTQGLLFPEAVLGCGCAGMWLLLACVWLWWEDLDCLIERRAIPPQKQVCVSDAESARLWM